MRYFTFFFPTIFSKCGLHNTVTAYLNLDCQHFKSSRATVATLLKRTAGEIGSYKPRMAFEVVTWLLSLVSWLIRTIMSAFIFPLLFFFFSFLSLNTKRNNKRVFEWGITEYCSNFSLELSKNNCLRWELKLRHFEANHMSFWRYSVKVKSRKHFQDSWSKRHTINRRLKLDWEFQNHSSWNDNYINLYK